mgnify:CR=1 FL=1
MEKYIVTAAFSVLEKVLLIPGDEIYAEPRLMAMMWIYSIKTRKVIGKVSVDTFDASTKLFVAPRAKRVNVKSKIKTVKNEK